MELGVDEHPEDGWLVVEVKGELDMATAPQLREQLQELIAAGHTRLVVDLTSLTFIDSSGLHVLLEGRERQQRQHSILRVVCPATKALKVFQVTGVDRLIPVYASVAEALAAPITE